MILFCAYIHFQTSIYPLITITHPHTSNPSSEIFFIPMNTTLSRPSSLHTLEHCLVKSFYPPLHSLGTAIITTATNVLSLPTTAVSLVSVQSGARKLSIQKLSTRSSLRGYQGDDTTLKSKANEGYDSVINGYDGYKGYDGYIGIMNYILNQIPQHITNHQKKYQLNQQSIDQSNLQSNHVLAASPTYLPTPSPSTLRPTFGPTITPAVTVQYTVTARYNPCSYMLVSFPAFPAFSHVPYFKSNTYPDSNMRNDSSNSVFLSFAASNANPQSLSLLLNNAVSSGQVPSINLIAFVFDIHSDTSFSTLSNTRIIDDSANSVFVFIYYHIVIALVFFNTL